MKPNRREVAVGRRNFLRTVAAGSAAAGALTATTLKSSPAQAYDPGRQELRSRYKADSPDVQAFYRTNGYETLQKKG